MKRLLLALALAAAAAATASNASAAGILINLNFTGSVTAPQQQTFIDAANFWSTTLTGYDYLYNVAGVAEPHSLTINVSIPYIDGAYGVLGSAGPSTATWYLNASTVAASTEAALYSTTGAMQFDSADVSMMITSNQFYPVVLHEMAHVLGFGTLWDPAYNNLYTDGTGQYAAPNALAAWKLEFNRPSDTYVPVELGGGSGTADAHWNEGNGGGDTGIVSLSNGLDLSRELMTGWASSTFFVSKATIGAFADLGYTVDYSQAGIINYVARTPEPSGLLLGAAPPLLFASYHLRRRRRTMASA